MARFHEKYRVDPETGCWLWTDKPDRHGYGEFWMNGRNHRAHNAAYVLLVGPIPDGLEPDHLCRVTLCVNPDHLEPVTHRENMLRGETLGARNAAKTHCPRGHPYDEANTYIGTKGGRWCRACKRGPDGSDRKYYLKRRNAQ